MNPIESRLSELAIQAWRGKFDEIEALADACGFEPKYHDRTLHIHGKINTALPIDHIDPLTVYVILGFAFVGELWAHVAGEGYKHTGKIWKEEVKQTKLKKKEQENTKLIKQGAA